MNHDAPDFRVLSPDRPILPNVRPPTALIADVRPIASNAHNAFVRARAEPRERSAVLERIGKLREENEQRFDALFFYNALCKSVRLESIVIIHSHLPTIFDGYHVKMVNFSTKRKSPLLPPVPGCPVAQLPPCPCWSLPGFARNSPHRRAAFSCGINFVNSRSRLVAKFTWKFSSFARHIVCRACAEEIKLVAAEQNNSQKCPICRKPSDFIKLK